MRRDIDEAFQGWPEDSEPGEVVSREVRARDGRTVLQIRIELGILQLEIDGRPDGTRPHGFRTYLDYLRHRAATPSILGEEDDDRQTANRDGVWTMGAEHCGEADREFFQFYHRRIAWLALRRYDRAIKDADHTLALMDFVADHGGDAEYIANHEKYRGMVLFHRTQAAAMQSLERRKAEEAIDHIREGIDRLNAHRRAWSAGAYEEGDVDRDDSDLPDEALIEQLRRLENEIRQNFAVEKTLQEQLDEAVAHEDYEKAARLRDQIRSRPRR